MVSQHDARAYLNFLNGKQVEVLNALERVYFVLVGTSPGEKIEELRKLHAILETLHSSVEPSSVPTWLKKCRSATKRYIENAQHDQNVGRELLHCFSTTYNELKQYNWSMDKPDLSHGIDFSELIAKIYSESDLPSLFDTLADILQKVVESGEIDSRTANEALQEVIDSIKKNTKRDAVSAQMCWDFARSYLVKVVPHLLRTTKVGEALLVAYEETVKEVGIKLPEVIQKISTEVQSAADKHLPSLQKLQEIGLKALVTKSLEVTDITDINDLGQ